MLWHKILKIDYKTLTFYTHLTHNWFTKDYVGIKPLFHSLFLVKNKVPSPAHCKRCRPWILEVLIPILLKINFSTWWVPPQSKVSPVLKLSEYATYFTVGSLLLTTLLLGPKSKAKTDGSVVAPLPWTRESCLTACSYNTLHSLTGSRAVLTRHIDFNWGHPLIF